MAAAEDLGQLREKIVALSAEERTCPGRPLSHKPNK